MIRALLHALFVSKPLKRLAPGGAILLGKLAVAADDVGIDVDVEAALTSSSAREVCSACELVAVEGLARYGPMLAGLVDDPVGASTDAVAVQQWALDGLIRMEVRLDSQTLRGWLADHPEEAITLLLQDVRRHRAVLFELVDSASRDELWLASVNGLMAARDAGLAQRLLRDLRFRREIFLGPSEQEFRGRGGGGFQGRSGHITHPRHQLLVRGAEEGDRLLAPGPVAVHLRRRMVRYVQRASYRNSLVDRNQYRIDLLAWTLQDFVASTTERARAPTLAHAPLGFTAVETLGLEWPGAERFDQFMTQLDEDLRARYRRLLRALRQEGLLSRAQIDALPCPLELVIRDNRPPGDGPLEEIPEPWRHLLKRKLRAPGEGIR